jgi:DNA-binding transcriptional MerR regulator
MKIQALAKRTGLTAPTIRFYENEGLLDERHVCRQENNYRDYSEEAIAHLALIKKFQTVGFSLSELKHIFHEHDANRLTILQVVELLTKKIEEIEHKQKEFKRISQTLQEMLAIKIALMNDHQEPNALFKLR